MGEGFASRTPGRGQAPGTGLRGHKGLGGSTGVGSQDVPTGPMASGKERPKGVHKWGLSKASGPSSTAAKESKGLAATAPGSAMHGLWEAPGTAQWCWAELIAKHEWSCGGWLLLVVVWHYGYYGVCINQKWRRQMTQSTQALVVPLEICSRLPRSRLPWRSSLGNFLCVS